VLDEADTLLAGGFVDDIAYVYGALPARKQACAQHCCLCSSLGVVSPHLLQVLAFSATYTDTLLAQLRQLMNAPQEVLLCPQTVALQGACTACSAPAACCGSRACARCRRHPAVRGGL
jgi:superfamily II DNA/RNA helicase